MTEQQAFTGQDTTSRYGSYCFAKVSASHNDEAGGCPIPPLYRSTMPQWQLDTMAQLPIHFIRSLRELLVNYEAVMKKIIFFGQKGGSGKSTLAIHTAIAAQEDGEIVAMIDTDPQQSVTQWGDVRTQETPMVATVASVDLARALAMAEKEGVTLVIVDTAPHASPEATRAVRSADLVVIPCRSAPFDIATVEKSADIVKKNGVRGVVVLSMCTHNTKKEETMEALAGCGLPVSPAAIGQRVAFVGSVSVGSGVTEFDGNGKAADEIRAFWNYLKEQVK